MKANENPYLLPDAAVGSIRLDAASPPANRIAMITASEPRYQQDSLRLRELLRDIKAALDDATFFSQHTLYVVELLKGLSRQVAVHFSLEEADNYFTDPGSVALELAGLADALRAEHRALAAEIDSVAEQADSLVDYAAQSESGQRRIVSRIRVFCYRLRDHERRENELLLQAYGEDVGVGD